MRLSELTVEEIRYVCSTLSFKEIVDYFNENPEDLARATPRGSRANIIKDHNKATRALFRVYKSKSASTFIEEHIKKCTEEIQEKITKRNKEGITRDVAVLSVLSEGFFTSNPPLFFKAIGEECPKDIEEKLAIYMGSFNENGYESNAKLNSENIGSKINIERELKNKDVKIKELKEKLLAANDKVRKLERKLENTTNEITKLRSENSSIKSLRSLTETNKKNIESLESEIQKRNNSIKNLKIQLNAEKKGRKNLESKIRSYEKEISELKTKHKTELEWISEEHEKYIVELESKHKVELEKLMPVTTDSVPNLRCPVEMEEFGDRLEDDLNNNGVHSEHSLLLKDYLCYTLFRGKPIVVSMSTKDLLIKCVSNALLGTPYTKTLSYRDRITAKEVDVFLSNEERIACLDNFISNYNETELIPLFERHKDKIIFITIAYDGMLKYVSQEFLKYVNYINVGRIPAMSGGANIFESRKPIEEIDGEKIIKTDKRYSTWLREILSDFGIRADLTINRASQISGEQDFYLCLAFDSLPFCIDVLNKSPFNASERLNRYSGIESNFKYKDLFRRWFYNE